MFHSVSAFNNAGFVLYSANMVPFATDAVICRPLAAGSIVGSIGFPVLFELWGRLRRETRRWSLHLRVTW